MNCLANFAYTQHLPPDVNIYIEPNADDAGVSIGAARHLHHTYTQDMTIRPLVDVYAASPRLDPGELERRIRGSGG